MPSFDNLMVVSMSVLGLATLMAGSLESDCFKVMISSLEFDWFMCWLMHSILVGSL